ncbi:MAG: hypothetical protein HQL20_11030 [Candidatus Omnitrophica bacterium]|nr:hypothetical protein [Candidatus Omnitrophota bacterium]
MVNLFRLDILRRPAFWLGLAFAVWTASLWGFISGRVGLSSDAVSYYEHTKFFLDQVSRGQFPLWDPYWSGGVPNDFFLRRIGPYNPFLLIPLVLKSLGVKFLYAYMTFLVLYFFFGMTGFYLLSRKLLKDDSAAFLAFLLLTFSALSTRMFDSYMLLVTIPIIWFFYFGVSFFQEPRKASAAGMTVALMLLLTTYIPLFFLVILLFFILAYVLVFIRDIPCRIKTLVSFIGQNWFFSALCALAIVLALVPGLAFFGEAGKGNIAIPGRHYNTDAKHVLVVEPQLLSPWSIVEEFFFSYYFTDLTRIAFAIVYVPLFAFLVIGAGVFTRITRLFLLLFLWGTALLLFSMPLGFPLYGFLYKHFAFVKYFRNLHFLLWFVGLPIFALFVGEIWKNLAVRARERDSWALLIVAGTVHVLAGFFLWWQGDALGSSFVVLTLSFLAWTVFLARSPAVRQWFIPLMFLAVVMQPVEVFHYLARNYPATEVSSFYNNLDYRFAHSTSDAGEGRIPAEGVTAALSAPGQPGFLYFTTDMYRNFRTRVSADDLDRYERFKFYLYDQPPVASDLRLAFTGAPVMSDSPLFRVVRFNANEVVIKADLPAAKFVVYNDVNYPGWVLKVNGKIQPLITANSAYKGFWLPAGKSSASLSFGSWDRYILNWSLLLVFYGILLYTAGSYWRRKYAAT